MNDIDDKENLKNEENDLKDNLDIVTREINLDDLYDGVVNNTVVIDPVTNEELLLKQKKNNFTFIWVLLAIITLLVLYYVNNKLDKEATREVEPKTTKEIVSKEVKEEKKGNLNCSYSSKSDAESQTLTYFANYEKDKVINSKFNYIVVSSNETISAVVKDLMNQYEMFYINNASVIGNNVTFEKHDKGFTFNVETNYNTVNFEDIKVVDEQTILYVKPTISDTIESLKEAYTDKGFICTMVNDEK